jgi:hypothetical protein
MRKSCIFVMICLMTLSVCGVGSADSQIQSPKPITKQGLIEALRIGGLSPQELAERVRERGVDFQLTPEVEAELRTATAQSELLEVVRTNYRPPSLAPSPPLSKADLLTLLQVGAASERVEQLVKQRGVSFQVTPDVERELQAAGVGPTLLATIREQPPATAVPSGAPAQVATTTIAAASTLVLRETTPVRLRLRRNLSSADAKVGETVDFEVLEDLKVDGLLLIARGATAIATVTEAQPKRRMARGGKLNVNIDFVRLVNNEKVALRAVKETKGGGHTGAMTGGIVATSIVFFPAAPFFLFMHGKDITIPQGTEITAYTNGEVRLDRSAFKAAR